MKKSKRKRQDEIRDPVEHDPPPDVGYRCEACGQPMILAVGFANTGLCGPCATGEAATLEEFGETW